MTEGDILNDSKLETGALNKEELFTLLKKEKAATKEQQLSNMTEAQLKQELISKLRGMGGTALSVKSTDDEASHTAGKKDNNNNNPSIKQLQ